MIRNDDIIRAIAAEPLATWRMMQYSDWLRDRGDDAGADWYQHECLLSGEQYKKLFTAGGAGAINFYGGVLHGLAFICGNHNAARDRSPHSPMRFKGWHVIPWGPIGTSPTEQQYFEGFNYSNRTPWTIGRFVPRRAPHAVWLGTIGDLYELCRMIQITSMKLSTLAYARPVFNKLVTVFLRKFHNAETTVLNDNIYNNWWSNEYAK